MQQLEFETPVQKIGKAGGQDTITHSLQEEKNSGQLGSSSEHVRTARPTAVVEGFDGQPAVEIGRERRAGAGPLGLSNYFASTKKAANCRAEQASGQEIQALSSSKAGNERQH